jgi:ATP-dependent DNA helicase 2 subunit 2
MGEVHYVWANPDSPQQQVALSSLVEAMDQLNMYAITRWVTRDQSDPKMGVLAPCRFQKVDCLLWVQVLCRFASQCRALLKLACVS